MDQPAHQAPGLRRHFPSFGYFKPAACAAGGAPPAAVAKGEGGRPKARWSDDLWIEMCRQLYEGDLKPKKQSDIKRAMMDWLSTHGEEPAESTIKDRARKLWAVIGKDEN
jgi:hypothetical protein